MAKKRADIYLVQVGIVESREQARRLIADGKAFADGKPISKPASLIEEHSHITILDKASYVSRGGLKLEKALHTFNIDPKGAFAVDVGASTGGFTDCLLRHGARTVTAIDVGYGQLAWLLRRDPRVIVMERTNIRYVKPEDLPDLADLVTIDVSFISLEKIFDAVAKLLKPSGSIVALVKPQFEVGKERVGKKGVVKDIEAHREVLSRLYNFIEEKGLFVSGLTYSPIKGPEGNVEFLMYVTQQGDRFTPAEKQDYIKKLVDEAHGKLNT